MSEERMKKTKIVRKDGKDGDWREGGRESMGARKCGRYLKIREDMGKADKDSRERGKEKFCDDL